MSQIKNIKDKDLALIIGNIMRWGVIISISITIIGGIIFLMRHGSEPIAFGKFREADHSILFILKSIGNGVVSVKGRWIIMLGILLLFATPFIRILFSLLDFIVQKDGTYIIITLIVLAIICISISGGLH